MRPRLVRILSKLLLTGGLLYASLALPHADTRPTDRPDIHFDHIQIQRDKTMLVLDMGMTIHLSREMIDALKHAIPLYFQTTIQVKEDSASIFGIIPNSRTLATHVIAVRLDWQHFEQRWRLINLKSGHVLTLNTLDEALNTLGTFEKFKLIDVREMIIGPPHAVEIRFQLDRNRLPIPLWLQSWLNPAWKLDSGRHTFYMNEDLLW